MYYVLTTLFVAATLALTNVVTQVGSNYIADYFTQGESQDYGINPPASSEREPKRTISAAREAASGDTATRSAVMPILLSAAEGRVPAEDIIPPRIGPGKRTDAGPEMEDLLPSPGLAPRRSMDADSPLAGRKEARAELPATIMTDAVEDTTPTFPPAEVVAPHAQPQAALDLVRDTPHRRPDGTFFLPMATQRIFSVRWQVCTRADVSMAYELPGHVITDPSTSTTLQATLSGVIEANQGTFPYLGMRVRRGDLLAYLQPSVSVSERAQIEARKQQLANQISLTEKQIERLDDVLFVRYRANKIEALKVQVEGYRRELTSLQSALGARETLRATVDGVISRVGAAVGGTVLEGQTIFEIVDPDALWVEAAAYDPAVTNNIKSAAAVVGDNKPIALQFVGGGLMLSNQAIPLRFRVVGPHEGLSVGKPVTVIVRQNKTIAGIPVPASSIIRDGDGRSIVWERIGAETFAPRQVRAVRVAGDVMVVESGLSSGARVVTEGASLLNQIR
ncbi:HlyD family efflux transporter periplasmic adaptor subunit [Aquabacter sp. CN5-332]|uniref:efflux RND transporter periplasmic adaptor subunit n=1 Tax=Aquabacter sp. CN5-332 TaxID=3156608 RepID=UPI0032B59F8A